MGDVGREKLVVREQEFHSSEFRDRTVPGEDQTKGSQSRCEDQKRWLGRTA